MGFKDTLFHFFEESEEEIKEELKSAQETINHLEQKLKRLSSKKEKSFFDENKEELKEELTEAKESVKFLKQKLKKLHEKKKGKKQVKVTKKPKKITKTEIEKKPQNIWWYVMVLGIITLMSLGFYMYSGPSEDRCSDIEKIEGDVGVACVKVVGDVHTDSHQVQLHFKNNLPYKASCSLNTIIKRGGVEISNKIVEFGTFESGEVGIRQIELLLPEGDTEFELIGSCVE